MENARFVLNEEKSALYPTEIGEWLGFTLNMKNFSLSVPHRKIGTLLELIASALAITRTSARKIARIAGLIISMESGIGPLARFMTRKMYTFVESCTSWDAPTSLPEGVLEEARFW